MHGVNPDEVNQQDFLEMCLMWNAGLVGNGEVLRTLGLLTQVQINKVLPKHVKAYSQKDLIPSYAEMQERHLTKEEQRAKVNEALNRYAGVTPMVIDMLRKKHGES